LSDTAAYFESNNKNSQDGDLKDLIELLLAESQNLKIQHQSKN